ncbi:hypothetical protein [Bacillus sp. FSL R5-0677]|uniref:hypothetical protein n=1 Tax=Bacillus sp. FSL R5-0677 TaxID=2921581 RepID=UPI0030F70EF3
MGKRKDRIFKDNFEIKEMKKIRETFKYIEEREKTFYTPDLIFEGIDNIVVLEHSSTGDRKVHIGELTQFIEYSVNSDSGSKKSLIIFLDGKSKNAPKKEIEQKRLKFYVDNVFSLNPSYLENIFFIGVTKYMKKLNNLSFDELSKECEIIYCSEYTIKVL